VRDISISLNVDQVNKDLNDNLITAISNNKGKHAIIFNLIDSESNYYADVLSRKYKVNLNKEFLNTLSDLKQLQVKIK
jgi:hypothetical protein